MWMTHPAEIRSMFTPPKLVPPLLIAAVALGFGTYASAQVPGPAPTPFPGSTAESPTTPLPSALSPAAVPIPPSASPQPVAAGTGRPSIAHVTAGNGVLPNDHGQIWREYDISPFTLHAAGVARSEQTIIDWILRQTGYEAWHSEPLGVLSATHTTLRAYHTPEMQAVVSEMVDRFVNPAAQSQMFGLQVVSLASPNWRAKFSKIMHALPVQSQGTQAWLLTKEDASLLLADLRKRSDFREFNAPNTLVANGQSTVVSTMRPRGYTGAVTLHPEQLHPGFEPQVMTFNEGFSLEFNPLLTLDGQSVDAMIKCDVDQLERTASATVDVPTPIAPRQHTDIEIPQTAGFRFRERFHWPANQVLIVSFGIVPAPIASEPAIRLTFNPGAPRAELLAIVDDRGAAANPIAATSPGALPAAALPTGPQPADPFADRRIASPIYRSPY